VFFVVIVVVVTLTTVKYRLTWCSHLFDWKLWGKFFGVLFVENKLAVSCEDFC